MDLTHAIALLITVLMLGVATKIGAIAVSAPNSSYAIVLIYTAFSIMIYLMTELIGLQRRPQFFSPLFSLSGFWFFACVLGLLILKFVVTMRLFDIGKLRALCLMVIIMTLMTLTTKALTFGLKSFHKKPNQSVQQLVFLVWPFGGYID